MKLLCLLVLVAGTARAAEDEQRWSVGAGATFLSLGIFSATAQLLPSSSPTIYVPGAFATLEYRLDAHGSLVLGADGSLLRSTSKTGPVEATSVQTSFGATGGYRSRLSRDGAPVGFSLVALVHLGYAAYSEATAAAPTNSAWDLSFLGGLAVERQLLEQLSMRLSAMVVSAGYTSYNNEDTSSAPPSAHAVHLGLGLAPSLELRLAF